jgi:hypothetical protein
MGFFSSLSLSRATLYPDAYKEMRKHSFSHQMREHSFSRQQFFPERPRGCSICWDPHSGLNIIVSASPGYNLMFLLHGASMVWTWHVSASAFNHNSWSNMAIRTSTLGHLLLSTKSPTGCHLSIEPRQCQLVGCICCVPVPVSRSRCRSRLSQQLFWESNVQKVNRVLCVDGRHVCCHSYQDGNRKLMF